MIEKNSPAGGGRRGDHWEREVPFFPMHVHDPAGLRVSSVILRHMPGAPFRPILSVPHGIVLAGSDTLRSLVSTVRYIEHFAHRSPGLGELMLLSLLSAVHSRDIAAAVDYPRPEEAHICGLFRNLGEVLIACHYPEEYSKIIVTMQARTSRAGPPACACWIFRGTKWGCAWPAAGTCRPRSTCACAGWAG